MKIKKNDIVMILSGKDKGKQGKVIKSIPREDKVVVEGIHVIKKIIRARVRGEKSTTVPTEYPIHVSKVALIDPTSKKPTRVGYRVEGDKKIRVTRKSNNIIA